MIIDAKNYLACFCLISGSSEMSKRLYVRASLTFKGRHVVLVVKHVTGLFYPTNDEAGGLNCRNKCVHPAFLASEFLLLNTGLTSQKCLADLNNYLLFPCSVGHYKMS